MLQALELDFHALISLGLLFRNHCQYNAFPQLGPAQPPLDGPDIIGDVPAASICHPSLDSCSSSGHRGWVYLLLPLRGAEGAGEVAR